MGNIFQRKPEDIENVLSIIKREFDEEEGKSDDKKKLKLSDDDKAILRTAAKAFMYSEYYIEKNKTYDELTKEEKTILDRAISWATQK